MNSTIKHYSRNAYLRMHRQSACVETLKSIYEKWLPTRVAIVSKSAIESYRKSYKQWLLDKRWSLITNGE